MFGTTSTRRLRKYGPWNAWTKHYPELPNLKLSEHADGVWKIQPKKFLPFHQKQIIADLKFASVVNYDGVTTPSCILRSRYYYNEDSTKSTIWLVSPFLVVLLGCLAAVSFNEKICWSLLPFLHSGNVYFFSPFNIKNNVATRYFHCVATSGFMIQRKIYRTLARSL